MCPTTLHWTAYCQKCALMCFLELPEHTAIISPNTNLFVYTPHTELSAKCKLNCHTAFKWRSERVFLRKYAGRIKNELNYICTPLPMFVRCAQARQLQTLCHTMCMNLNDLNFFTSSYQVLKITLPQKRRWNSYESWERYNNAPVFSLTT